MDVGPTMGKAHHGRAKHDLDWGMDYIYNLIANKIMSERKTDVAGLVAVNSKRAYFALLCV